jgi:hypothetical protein
MIQTSWDSLQTQFASQSSEKPKRALILESDSLW